MPAAIEGLQQIAPKPYGHIYKETFVLGSRCHKTWRSVKGLKGTS